MRSLRRVGRHAVPVVAAVLAVTAGPAIGTTTVVDTRTIAWGGTLFGSSGLAGVSVAAGLDFNVAVCGDGTVWTWGA